MTTQCLKKFVQPEDIARMALFLSADDSKFITAQVFKGDSNRPAGSRKAKRGFIATSFSTKPSNLSVGQIPPSIS